MPSYELSVILRNLSKPETASVLKRVATRIMDSRGFLFQIENLGTRTLPHAMKAHGFKWREGSYFLMHFDYPSSELTKLEDEYKRDVDIIRYGVAKKRIPLKKFDCKLEDETKPPAYREDVQKMITEGRELKKKKFDWNNGLDYNPFRT